MVERSDRVRVRLDQAEELGAHPLSKLVDPMTDQEYEAFKADIDDHGLADPRIYRYEGKCLDGNSRRKACRELGLGRDLEVVEFDPRVDGDPAIFVVSKNVRRRLAQRSR
jgi:hypothetical protein